MVQLTCSRPPPNIPLSLPLRFLWHITVSTAPGTSATAAIGSQAAQITFTGSLAFEMNATLGASSTTTTPATPDAALATGTLAGQFVADSASTAGFTIPGLVVNTAYVCVRWTLRKVVGGELEMLWAVYRCRTFAGACRLCVQMYVPCTVA